MRTDPSRRRLRAAGLSVLSLVLAGCVATSPNQNPSQAVGDVLRSLGGGGSPVPGLSLGGAAAPGGSGNLIEMLKQSVETIDEPREIEIGRQLAAILLGSKPLHPDARLQRYVNQLGRWISLQSSRPQLPWTFMVLDDNGFNAFAAPGGYIFVTKGLVDQAVGEAELAGVLAHEIVHVVEKHHLKALGKTARAGLVTQVAASQLRSDLAGAVGSQLLSLGKNLYSKGLDREDEFDADRRGVALAARAGLDPFGLPSLLHTLAAVKPDNPQYLLALSTHPPTDQRLDQLQAAMGNRLNALADRPAVTIAQRLSPPPVAQPAVSRPPPAARTPQPPRPAPTKPATTTTR